MPTNRVCSFGRDWRPCEMPYRIRFTIKRTSPSREISKHTYGVVHPMITRPGDALHVGHSSPVQPYDEDEATEFETYRDAVAALSSWFMIEDRDVGGLWVKNQRIERVRV